MENKMRILRQEIKEKQDELEKLVKLVNEKDRAERLANGQQPLNFTHDDEEDDDDYQDDSERQRWLREFTARQAHYHSR